MKKLVIFAAVCGTALVGASPPTGNGYPPCSSTVTDRCIQLYERGVATPTNLALNEQLGPGRVGSQLAMGGPYEPLEPDDSVTGDVYAASDYADAGWDQDQDIVAAEDIADDGYAGSEWAATDEEDMPVNWSGYEDQATY